jgi:hypothetical protein
MIPVARNMIYVSISMKSWVRSYNCTDLPLSALHHSGAFLFVSLVAAEVVLSHKREFS